MGSLCRTSTTLFWCMWRSPDDSTSTVDCQDSPESNSCGSIWIGGWPQPSISNPVPRCGELSRRDEWIRCIVASVLKSEFGEVSEN
jgi:hypothetical protein